MRVRKIIIAVFLTMICGGAAAAQGKFGMGIGAGVDYKGSLRQDFYFKVVDDEYEIGIQRRTFKTDHYPGYENLKLTSLGLYMDVQTYPRDFFFIGGRWNVLSVNWKSNNNHRRYLDQEKKYQSIGMGLSLKSGFSLRVNPKIQFKVYSLLGLYIMHDPKESYVAEDELHIKWYADYHLSLNFGLDFYF